MEGNCGKILMYLSEKSNTYMRIAMIGQKGIPAAKAQGGGVETHVEMLATHLQQRGHHVTVYVRPYANPERKKSWNRIKLITLPTIRRKHLDAIVHVFLSSIHVLFQDVDIVHYHGVGASTLSWIPRVFKPGTKIIATFHSHDRLNRKWKWLARTYLTFGEWTINRFPHQTITVSHNLQLFCRKMYGRDAAYIPNAVEVPSKISGTSYLKDIGVKPNEYLITLGRLTPVKAYEFAIAAFSEIETDKKLLIIGEAPPDSVEYKFKLERMAAKDERVIMLGEKTGEELEQLLAHCYCMVHPSKVEGLAFVILEAMSHGKLVVMSDIPANRELVDHSGITFPVGDVDKLREVLQWLISDPVLVKIRGTRAIDVVRRLYNWDYITEKTESEYEKLLTHNT